jgi:uncharacterized protein YlxW (UPF0749 family)
MEEMTAPTTTPKTAAEYEAAVDALLAEMARMNERSEQTWAEIERLKAESAAIQAEKQLLNASIDRRLEALTGLL